MLVIHWLHQVRVQRKSDLRAEAGFFEVAAVRRDIESRIAGKRQRGAVGGVQASSGGLL
jgi:hypothetical protein